MQPALEFKKTQRLDPLEIRTFLDANPHIYWAFEREALRVIEHGHAHYSARTIVEVLRHQSALEADPSKQFKINDHITPTLARDFMDRHPEAPAGFFELRGARVRRLKGDAA